MKQLWIDNGTTNSLMFALARGRGLKLGNLTSPDNMEEFALARGRGLKLLLI